MPRQHLVSIVIVNKNELGLADTLVALREIKKPAPTEVIVVDASEPSYVAHIRNAHPEVTWIHFDSKAAASNAPNKRTVGIQRNLGVRTAKGDIVVFIDATCVPVQNWLVDLTAPIIAGEESLVAGSVVSNDPKTHVNIQPPSLKDKYLGSAATINLAFTKKLYEEVGPFDESLHFGSDVDFTWRASDVGYKVRFIPSATVSHDWGNRKSEFKRSYRYGRAKANLYAKHPARMKPLADDPFLVVYVGYLLALPVTFLLPWYPLTIVALMFKNWRSQPVKTVAIHIVYAAGAIRQGAAILARVPVTLRPNRA